MAPSPPRLRILSVGGNAVGFASLYGALESNADCDYNAGFRIPLMETPSDQCLRRHLSLEVWL